MKTVDFQGGTETNRNGRNWLKKRTKKQIAILAKVIGRKQFAPIAIWADDAWEQAKKVGLVTDPMMEATPAH